MKLSDDLRYEHEVLRAKLALVEEHLPSLRGARVLVFRFVNSLASRLKSHTEREERLFALLALYRGAPAGASLQQLHEEHAHQQEQLASLEAMLAQDESDADEQAVAQAASFMNDLREHMAQEEHQFFPLLDQEDAEQERGVAVAAEDEQFLGLA